MGFKEVWEAGLVFAGALLGISSVLSGLVYMLSELLQNEKMKGWAKIELTEVFYSALILAMAMPTLLLIDNVVQGALIGQGGSQANTVYWIPMADYGTFSSGQKYYLMDICGPRIASDPISVYHGVESCHIRLGIWYLRTIFDEAKTFAFDIYLSYIATSMLSEFTINIEFVSEKAGFFTFTPWRGFFTMGNKVKELVFDWAIKLMMLTKFQEVMLYFIGTALFPALFTIGVVLRTFAFSRKLGGLLLAMAIALYFVFPAFYAFGALVMLEIKQDTSVRNAWMGSIANPCNQGVSGVAEDCADPPIANSMYMVGAISMPGGGKSAYNASEAQKWLLSYEGMDSRTYYSAMEAGTDSSGAAMVPLTDPQSGAKIDMFAATRSDEETKAAMEKSKAEIDNWYKETSKTGKLDKFIGRVWLQNGPLDSLARLTFWSVFFSLFGIIATIAAIRSLSMTFGGDIEIAGLTRLI
jgi:hypothetical protein